ncbi:MAG: ATP-dependent 6-phosphofructokinase [Spirochaetales bacterium]|nr:ATP-dependent 6-phosphofructokinase [Spirochaetales bacterium]
MNNNYDFSVEALGKAKTPSPITYSTVEGDELANYVRDEEHIQYDIEVDTGQDIAAPGKSQLLQLAGPRQKIYFSPSHAHAAIATCGGLCPGLNDVIRGITRCLWYRYGVHRITGIRFGYQGFLPENNISPVELNPTVVDDIHKIGGTVLGSSRGGGDRIESIVDAVEQMNMNILFLIGGDGTQRAAIEIAEEVERRSLKIAVVGVPKTIDNDLAFIDRSFGFQTAVAEAVQTVVSAHTEAHSAINGIGLVKLMGRASGFIAANTAVASHEANFVLVPEVPFEFEGHNGFLEHLRKRIERRGHAVVIVAEGSGQEHFPVSDLTDASGNRKLGDIGVYLKDKITDYFKKISVTANLKYIDPSYIIRSAVAAPTDALYCARLGNNAAHAAMSGKTKVVISQVNNFFVHVPIGMVVSSRRKIDPESSLWRDVIEATHQPMRMTNE